MGHDHRRVLKKTIGLSIRTWLVRRHFRRTVVKMGAGDARAHRSYVMSRLRVNEFGISIDGYGAGPDQDLPTPMGVGGMALHQWVFATKTFQKMAADFAGSLIGDEVGREGVDDDFAARGFENIVAWIMGRNMFGPMRGPWSDDSWKGWWGENSLYYVTVYVLHTHAR